MSKPLSLLGEELGLGRSNLEASTFDVPKEFSESEEELEERLARDEVVIEEGEKFSVVHHMAHC
jgi:hypothetical protein